MKGVILAGGSGSRLWPLSREEYPKQLLTLDNGESLLQKTFSRLRVFSEASDIVTITNKKHLSSVKLQLNQIDNSNVVIGEPFGKNTAPAIAAALKYFTWQSSDDDVVLIAPSDHLINDIDGFTKTVEEGRALAELGYIVTFGIKPTYPETGYGYIKTNAPLSAGYKVEKFVEKPDLETAREYLNSGNYYWNAGIFMGKISTFLGEFKKYTTEIYTGLAELDFSNSSQIAPSIYEKIPSISIDYAIMEKSNNIALVELKSDWNDLGSFQALYNVKEKDKDGNVLIGDVVVDNVKDSFIHSQKSVVAASSLENIVIVETEDAIMACKLDESQNVKTLYQKLQEKDSDTVKLHKTVFRPWGYYTCMSSGAGYLTKTICVMPKQKLSLQSHNYRSEHWVVLEGKALVILDDKEYHLNPGESIDIPVQAKHSLQNPHDVELKIIEVQNGDHLSEDDIIRYQDCYGRV